MLNNYFTTDFLGKLVEKFKNIIKNIFEPELHAELWEEIGPI